MEMNELKEIARFLFDNGITSHIENLDNDFYNGLILELHETFIVINDRVLGKTPIAFSEIKIVERFRGR